MDASQQANIIILQSNLTSKNLQKLKENFDHVIKMIRNKSISGLNKIDCGIAFLQDSELQTSELLILLEDYLKEFKASDDLLHVQCPTGFSFKHMDLYNLIFSNLYCTIFEIKVKQLIQKYFDQTVKDVLINVQDKSVFTDSKFEQLQDIQKQKIDEEEVQKFNGLANKDYEFFRESKEVNLTNNELILLDTLLEELLSKHTSYSKDLQNELINMSNNLNQDTISILRSFFNSTQIKAPPLRYAPVKGKSRTLTKLKENIVEKRTKKFPLNSLKDLSRGSQVFGNADELLVFFNAFKHAVENNPKFIIFEIKNGFNNTGKSAEKIEETKQAQKDVKLILAQKPNDMVSLMVELQLILEPILNMKMVLHKFQDITRTDFHPLRIEFMRILDKETYIKNKNKKFVWNETQPLYHISKLGQKIKPFVEDIMKRGEKIQSRDDLSTYQLDGCQVQHYTTDNNKTQQVHPYGEYNFTKNVSTYGPVGDEQIQFNVLFNPESFTVFEKTKVTGEKVTLQVKEIQYGLKPIKEGSDLNTGLRCDQELVGDQQSIKNEKLEQFQKEYIQMDGKFKRHDNFQKGYPDVSDFLSSQNAKYDIRVFLEDKESFDEKII